MIEGKLDSNEEGRCFSKLSTFDPGFEEDIRLLTQILQANNPFHNQLLNFFKFMFEN